MIRPKLDRALARAHVAVAYGCVASMMTASLVASRLGGNLQEVPVLSAYMMALNVPMGLAVYVSVALLPFPRIRKLALPATAALMGVVVLWTAALSLASTPSADVPRATGPVPVPAPHRPVIVVALDGADWELLEAGIEAGELPTFGDLVRRGARGKLETLVPTLSPAIWTTAATGYPPERHGIRSFAWTLLRGSGLRFGNRVVTFPGQDFLLRAATRFGLTHQIPLSSADRRAPTVWGLASAAGERVAVVHWWASWPAEPLEGWLVTDRFFFHRDLMKGMTPDVHRLTHPPELARELAPFVLAPRDVEVATLSSFMKLPREELESILARVGSEFEAHTVQSELPYWIALDRTYGEIALHVLETAGPWDFFAVYLRGLDLASHAALEYDPRFNPKVDRESAERFGSAVRQTYRWTDRWLAGLLDRAPDDALVLVLSDHGWRTISEGSPRVHHTDGPPGLVIATGPTVEPGTVISDASVQDVAPTLLHALGLPVPEDLDGRVWSEIVGPERPVSRAKPWRGTTLEGKAPASSKEVEEELLRHLEALGYLDGES